MGPGSATRAIRVTPLRMRVAFRRLALQAIVTNDSGRSCRQTRYQIETAISGRECWNRNARRWARISETFRATRSGHLRNREANQSRGRANAGDASDFRQCLHKWLEKRGDLLVTCANMFQLGGFACYDVLMLQSLMIVGNGSMALFFITRMPPMGVAFGWAALKVCVNIFMVFSIMRERQPIHLTGEELEVYEDHFMPFGVTARQFKRFWDLGETRQFEEGEMISREGKPIESVVIVLSGRVIRTIRGQHVPALDTSSRDGNYDKPESPAGAWVGEITALRMLDAVAQDHTVHRGSTETTEKHDAEQVEKLQATLAGFGFYEGAIDGRAGQQTSRALHKLEETSGLVLDGIDGPKTQKTRETVEEWLHHHNAAWSAHASKGTVARLWKLEPLLASCWKNAEMRGMLRKAFSQSAIRKIMVMQASPGSAAQDIQNMSRAVAATVSEDIPKRKVVPAADSEDSRKLKADATAGASDTRQTASKPQLSSERP